MRAMTRHPIRLALCASAAAMALAGCAGAPRALPPTSEARSARGEARLPSFHEFFRALPSIGLRPDSPDGKVRSPVAGNVVAAESVFPDASALGKSVCVRTSVEYAMDNNIREDSFLVVIGGLESATAKPGPIKAGDAIGTTPGGEFYCAIAADFASPYLVVMSPCRAERAEGRWWFDPSFLFSSGTTSWLTFDPIASFGDAVKDIGDHVRSESVSMQVFFDRYRFAARLEEYPIPLTDEEKGGIRAYERVLYEKDGIYEFGQRVHAGGYEVLLCWQEGFDRYLRDEYEPGGLIWLFGNLVTYDPKSETAYFFIRDFALESVEEMYARKAPPADA
jgi:hypothetical protein